MKRLLKFIVIITLFLSCNKTEENEFIDSTELFGKWTFLKKTNVDYKEYVEIEFEENKKLNLYSENDGKLGPFSYSIEKDTFILHNTKYKIVSFRDKIELKKNDTVSYEMYRIPFRNENISNKNQINPFYIRRCYFLIHLNQITTEEATNYLKSINIIEGDSIYEETPIFKNELK